MTYITPDDLAMRQEMRDPWSKRGMVARAYLRQDNSLDQNLPLMPSIPYSPVQLQRRVPTRPQPPGRYPYDGGWRDPGMSGMGADPLQDMLEELTAKLKSDILAQTAIVTGLAISVQAFPVVGQIIGGVLLLVNGLIGASLQRQGQSLLADFQDEMTRAAAAYQAKVAEAQSIAFEQEKPAAVQLALSNETLQGLGSWIEDILHNNVVKTILNPLRVMKYTVLGPITLPKLALDQISKIPGGFGEAAKTLNTPFTKIEEQIDRPIRAVDEAVDTVTGMKGLDDIQDAIAKARPRCIAEMEGMTNGAIANINSAVFRAQLRNNIAKAIRSSKPFQMVTQPGTLTIPDVTGATPGATLSALPMAAAAGGAILIMLGLGKH